MSPLAYARVVVSQAASAFVRGLKAPMLGFLVVVLAWAVAFLFVPSLVGSFMEDVQKGVVLLIVVIVGLFVIELVRAQYMLFVKATAASPAAAVQQTLNIFVTSPEDATQIALAFAPTQSAASGSTVTGETGEGSDTTTSAEPPKTDIPGGSN